MAKVCKSDGEGTVAGPRGNDKVAPKDETAPAVIGETRGLGSSGKQPSCLEIEGP